MTARFLTTTALVLTLALPAVAVAGQSVGVSQETKVESSTEATATTGQSQLLADARAQLRNAMATLEEVKDSAGEKFTEAREGAREAIGKLEAALESAKAQIAESSREAVVATRAKIAEARALIEDQKSEPQAIASSLGAAGDAAGGVNLSTGQTADGQAQADAGAKAGAGAKSDTGVVGKVGSALGLSSDTSAKGSVGTSALQEVGLVGKTLYGADQEPVGEIKDVVMSDSGKVESVLVDVGGFLGIGAKQVAVPVENVEVQGETLVAASLNKRQAEQMPEYKHQQ